MAFTDIAEVRCDPALALVHEQGWQSWSPSGTYPAAGTSPRPSAAIADARTMGYRPGPPAPETGFQSEGMVAIDPGDGGPVRLWYAPDPLHEVPSVRVRAEKDRLVLSADGLVVEQPAQPAQAGEGLGEGLGGGLGAALECWADGMGKALGARVGPGSAPPPAVWCSWYCYWRGVTQADIEANLRAMDRACLPFDVVQVDDGYQHRLGDWLEAAPGFGPPAGLAARIRDTGRGAGIWTAPLLAGRGSRLALEHPEWLVGDADPGRNWDERPAVLDVTHPEAAEHLTGVFATLRSWGFSYFKIDFLYAGALPGVRRQDCSPLDAYVEGLRLIREAVGPDAYLLGCGAPLLPSIGFVDAMRVGPDIAPHYEPECGDLSKPGQRGAVHTSAARAFTDRRLWAADPDCLIARPEVERREEWADFLLGYPGLRSASDPIEALDDRGTEITRRFLVRE